MTGNERAAACLSLFASPKVARFVLQALAAQHRALEVAGRSDPEVSAFLAELGRRSVQRRQSAPFQGEWPDTRLGSDGPLVGVGEAAKFLGVSRRTLERRLAGLDTAVVRIGRRVLVDPTALLDQLQRDHDHAEPQRDGEDKGRAA